MIQSLPTIYTLNFYEYLKEKINIDKEEIQRGLLPDGFKDLQYQRDAVKDAKLKVEEYGEYFFLMLWVWVKPTLVQRAQQLEGRTLVIAPPILVDKDNPGSWPNVFGDFGVRGPEFESRGKLDKILERVLISI